MNLSKISQLTKNLVACQTLPGTPAIKTALHTISQLTSSAGLKSKLMENSDTTNLWITNHTWENPALILVCHIDVVAAPATLFLPKEKGNKIFGRGAFDMKGPTAAMIAAITDIKTPKNIQLLITSDEEIGGTKGASWFFKKTGLVPKVALIPDGLEDNQIVIKQKGPMHIVVTAKGVSTHGSKPWVGTNPITTLITIKERIEAIEKQATNADDWLPTFTITNIEAKASINQIPALGTMTIDIRATNQQQISRIKRIIKEEGATITKTFGDGKIFQQKETHARILWQKIAAAKPVISAGASDARHVPIHTTRIVTQAKGGGAHSLDEWVSIKSLEKLATHTKTFINKI